MCFTNVYGVGDLWNKVNITSKDSRNDVGQDCNQNDAFGLCINFLTFQWCFTLFIRILEMKCLLL